MILNGIIIRLKNACFSQERMSSGYNLLINKMWLKNGFLTLIKGCKHE